MIDVGCYIRVSTQEQALHGYSVSEQTERTQKYCDAMKWHVFRVYTDAGFSGSNTDRPALQQMIADAARGRIQKVIVYKLDRLSRSQKDTLALIEDSFIAHGVDFISMSENFDTSTPFGRAMVGILAVFAQLEREQIKERMTMGRLARAKKGGFMGTHAPIGYSFTETGLKADLYEADLIRRVFSLYSSGRSARYIADALNDAGLTHKYGPWNKQTVSHAIESRVYIGEVILNGCWYPGTHEAIIDKDFFESVQDMKDRRREAHEKLNRRNGKANSYFGGFIVCGHCGAKYGKIQYKNHAKNGKIYYYNRYICASRSKRDKKQIKDPNCNNKIWTMKDFDDAIFGEIRKLALDPDYISAGRPESDAADRTALLESEIEKLDDQISRLMDLYTVDGIPVDVLQDRIKKISDRKALLIQEEKSEALRSSERMSKDQARKIVQSFEDILARQDLDEIREMIGSLVKKIVVNGGDLTIYWTFD